MGKPVELQHWEAAGRDWARGATQKQSWLMRYLLGEMPNPEALFHRSWDKQMVLLPGVWEPWPVLLTWARVLSAQKWSVSFVPALDLMLGEVDELAATLQSAIESRFGRRAVVVAAHSKGGLVAKTAILRKSTSTNLAGVVACGTPFFGAPIVRFTPTVIGLRDLAPETVEHAELGYDWESNRKTALIEAAFDQNVPRINRMPGAFRATVPVRGHNALLESEDTARLIDRFGTHFLGLSATAPAS